MVDLAQLLPPLPSGFAVDSPPAGAPTSGLPSLPPGFQVETTPLKPPVVPWMKRAVGTVTDSVAGAVDTVRRIETGEVREPSQLSAPEMLGLGALGTTGALTSFSKIAAPAAGSALTEAGRSIRVDIPRAVTKPGMLTQLGARITGAVPWSGAPLRKASGNALEQLQTAASGVKNDLGSSSLYTAGKGIESGIEEFGSPGGILSQKTAAAYSKVDNILREKADISLPGPGATPTVNVEAEVSRFDDMLKGSGLTAEEQADARAAYQRAAEQYGKEIGGLNAIVNEGSADAAAQALSAGEAAVAGALRAPGWIQPKPGAPGGGDRTTALLSNTMDLVTKAQADAEGSGTSLGRAFTAVQGALAKPDGLTYQGLKNLRTKIGEWVDNKPLAAQAGVSDKEASAVYAALSRDLENVVEKAGGPEALTAWEAANATAVQAAEIRTALSKILKTGNEGEGALFTRLAGMAGSNARADVDTLVLAREAVGDRNWSEVLSALVEKTGFDENGSFSPQKFTNQWGKLTPEGKAVLFRTPEEKAHLASLDSIAKVSALAGKLEKAANPGNALIAGTFGLSGVSTVVGTLSPQSWPYLATAVFGSRVVSNVLAKPEGAARFAQWAWAYQGFSGRPSATTAAALGNAARGLAYFVAQHEGLDNKSQLYLGNYLQGAPIGQPLAKPKPLPSTPTSDLHA